ncbi:hypothetical protein ACLKA6_014551 [Drosophila palustris]
MSPRRHRRLNNNVQQSGEILMETASDGSLARIETVQRSVCSPEINKLAALQVARLSGNVDVSIFISG